MSRRAQAFGDRDNELFRWDRLLPLAACLLAVGLSGCASRGNAIDRFMTDDTLITGSIEPASVSIDEHLDSDKATIRNAVSSAIVGETPTDGLGWANAATGSRGMIRDIEEARAESGLCREFTATRESFSGAHLYHGRACLDPSQSWALLAFDRVE